MTPAIRESPGLRNDAIARRRCAATEEPPASRLAALKRGDPIARAPGICDVEFRLFAAIIWNFPAKPGPSGKGHRPTARRMPASLTICHICGAARVARETIEEAAPSDRWAILHAGAAATAAGPIRSETHPGTAQMPAAIFS